MDIDFIKAEISHVSLRRAGSEDEPVVVADLKLSFFGRPEHLRDLLGTSRLGDALWDKDGYVQWPHVQTIALHPKFRVAPVTMIVGDAEDEGLLREIGVHLESVSLAKFALDPLDGHGVAIAFTAACTPGVGQVDKLAALIKAPVGLSLARAQDDMFDGDGGVRDAVRRMQETSDRAGTTMTISTGDGREIARFEPRAGEA